MLRIHDLMTAFEGLNVPGLAYYADRALILPGAVMVKDGPIDDHLAYLRDVGIGADEVIRVDADDLVRTVHRNAEVRAIVAERVRAGRKLQFFNSTREEQALLDALGIDWGSTFSAPPDVSLTASSKADLRRLGTELGLEEVFPRNIICTGRVQTYAAIGRLFQTDAEFLVLKRPDLASGDGMVRVLREENWADGVEAYLDAHAGHEIIVECGYGHVAMSVQWEIGDEAPAFVCGTSQLIEKDFVHLGNVISTGELPLMRASDVEDMRRMTLPFAEAYRRRGYRGVCGFDLMKCNDGRMFLLECNGRVTATTYAYGLARQIAPRVPSWTVVMTNLRPSDAFRSFSSIRRRLRPRLFNGRTGVLPFNLRCLGLPSPKFTVCCVGRDLGEALAGLRFASERLT